MNGTTTTLEGHTHLRFRMSTTARTAKFNVSVQSEMPVTTYFLDQNGLDAYYENENVRQYSYGGATNRREHQFTVKLRRGEVGYLLVVNNGDEPTAVHVTGP